MTIKNLIYTIPLPEVMFDSCIDSFAFATGWTESSEDTKLEHSRKALNQYVNQTITAYNAAQAADVARLAALSQGAAALGQITTTLTVD